MSVAAPLALRWERAQQIDRSAIQDIGQGLFFVPSSQGGHTGYTVTVAFNQQGKLASASCTCPDYEKRLPDPNTPMLHGIRVCKHVLAASLKANEARQSSPALPAPNGQNTAVSIDGMTESDCPVSATPGPLPVAGAPFFDPQTWEWCLIDSDNIRYYGSTASECIRQFHDALHYLAEHARKSGDSPAELRQLRALPASA